MRVGADECVILDHGAELVGTVVVAGDGTGTDIDAAADRGVADVGEMVGLGMVGDGRILDLDEVADMNVATEFGAGAQPSIGADDGLLADHRILDVAEGGNAGAAADARTLLLAGVAGLLAGAFSMAAGEYVSVRSQREVFEYQIGLEEAELREYPDEEAQELAVIYEAKGLPPEEAARLARTLIADPARALDTLAREELGLNPDDLGSPWGAAVSSFTAFAAGAAIPLAPLLLAAGPHAIRGSVAAAGLALFAVGAALSLFTGRAALASGLRMLAIGAAAGTTTYLLGALIAGGSAI